MMQQVLMNVREVVQAEIVAQVPIVLHDFFPSLAEPNDKIHEESGMTMTEQDLTIQNLRRENDRLRMRLAAALADLSEIIVNGELCRYCAYFDADCSPAGGNCVPKWRGMK